MTGAEPFITVLAGDPTADEIAAIAVLLLAQQAGAPAQQPAAAARTRWAAPTGRLSQSITPRSWRESGY